MYDVNFLLLPQTSSVGKTPSIKIEEPLDFLLHLELSIWINITSLFWDMISS